MVKVMSMSMSRLHKGQGHVKVKGMPKVNVMLKSRSCKGPSFSEGQGNVKFQVKVM
jgi:hypothetical protein